MTTIVLEIKDKGLFFDLDKRLQAKINVATDELEGLGLSDAILDGQKDWSYD
jgi:hypothetical protein